MPSTRLPEPPKPSLWAQIRGVFSRKPDTRPDPEDPSAYDHFDPIAAKFADRAKPVQILRENGKRPPDVFEDAESLGILPAPPGWTYWIDVYESPAGPGYQVCYEVRRGQKTFRKVVNVGPETARDRDWEEVVDELPAR